MRRQRASSCGAAAAPRAACAAPPLLLLLLLLAAAPRRGAALKVTVHQGDAAECLTQHVGQEHFEAEGAPRIEGAFFVGRRHENVPASATARLYSPSGELMWTQSHVDAESHFNIAARGPGTYKICFESHTRADMVVDLVYLTLGHLRRPGVVNVPKGTSDSRSKEIAKRDHLEDVRRGVMVVGELVEIVGGEQRYLQRKLERHIQTCHSNNRRTLGYTLLEVAALAGVSLLNIGVVTGMFRGAAAGAYGGRIVV
ncbi:hypothetical protein Rsub_04856 [Raphidocelis subcapitata]|uniref:GOLD domain-containing protein n=1 Tax=Raphidocelis subcapitata TaxID=307507 RepID=A0A2V0P1W4_9CHLO|nr:hypothetical protein Rsub_04856 [Raphidocelis subcapitata]|eukprot:GBF91187.1 hypothetical protein Rsub_04856 [Raphidocelis subcapitata]